MPKTAKSKVPNKNCFVFMLIRFLRQPRFLPIFLRLINKYFSYYQNLPNIRMFSKQSLFQKTFPTSMPSQAPPAPNRAQTSPKKPGPGPSRITRPQAPRRKPSKKREHIRKMLRNFMAAFARASLLPERLFPLKKPEKEEPAGGKGKPPSRQGRRRDRKLSPNRAARDETHHPSGRR